MDDGRCEATALYSFRFRNRRVGLLVTGCQNSGSQKAYHKKSHNSLKIGFGHSRKPVYGMQVMTCYDVFNGDADGICALVQLRLAEPREAVLVTGVKRDINLLARVSANPGDPITALDISMRTNAKGLRRILDAGAHVFYVDHHNPGDIPKHENLLAVIDTRPKICTSLLVNKALNGTYKEWAIIGAFGDNLADVANEVARSLSLKTAVLTKLKSLGELINYNAYGRDTSDLHFTPEYLFKQCVRYKTPSLFLSDKPKIFDKLKTGYAQDMAKAKKCRFTVPGVTILGDAPWARRVSGSYGNILAVENPNQAHAVLTHNADDGYLISVRAPKNNPNGADKLCLSFPTGGGRAAAAGINHLPKDDLGKFLDTFKKAY